MLKTKANQVFQPSQQPSQTIADPRKSMTVERLLNWTYQDQQADWIVGRGGAYARVVGIDSARRAGDRMALGCEVMGGGYARLLVHPDAEAIHDAVKRLPGRMIGMVIKHAKAGTRPDWLKGQEPTPKMVARANGKPVMVYHDAERRRPAYCLLRYDPLPEHVDYCRRIYALWWDALDGLVASSPTLIAHKMLPLGEPREPWIAKDLTLGEKLDTMPHA